jgi:hypothetical protein
MSSAPLIAQAAVERRMLDGMAASVASARYQLEAWVGPGNARWVIIAALAVLVLWVLKRR